MRSTLAALALLGVILLASGSGLGQPPPLVYDLSYDVRVTTSEGVAHVSIRSSGPNAWTLYSVRLRIDPERHFDFRGDGEIETLEDGKILWKPPREGGALRYAFRIDHLRDPQSYDARCAETWALFRGDDLVPPARVVSEVGSRSRSRLRMRLPAGWSVVVPYEKAPDGSYLVVHDHRRFDRPTGWFALGRLAVLREKIAGTRVAVAAPVGQGVRRQDILAMLRWTLPELRDAVGTLPERLVVVGAGDPMWRGGLSGPDSVYLHADRPLVTNDLTSPLLHELMHAVLGIRAEAGADWIVEGLAELYSIELLRRGGTVSRRRYQRALAKIAERGKRAPGLAVESAAGDVTARAVAVLHDLDLRLEEESGGEVSLDDVVARLRENPGRITNESFRALVSDVAGSDQTAFFRSQVGLPIAAKAGGG